MEIFDQETARAMKIWEARVLRPRAATLTTAELMAELEAAHARLLDALAQIGAERSRDPLPQGYMSYGNMVAHLAFILDWQTQGIDCIRSGKPLPVIDIREAFGRAGERSWSALQEEFECAWKRFHTLAGAQADETAYTAPHPLFGELNVREWVLVTAAHFDYHRAQMG